MTHMETCPTCSGSGRVLGIGVTTTCRTCHGAGEYEAWGDISGALEEQARDLAKGASVVVSMAEFSARYANLFRGKL